MNKIIWYLQNFVHIATFHWKYSKCTNIRLSYTELILKVINMMGDDFASFFFPMNIHSILDLQKNLDGPQMS